MLDIIAVLSVPHSGTHSIMNLIDADGYKQFQENMEIISRKHNKRQEVHGIRLLGRTHISLWGLTDLTKQSDTLLDAPILDKEGLNIIHGHIDNTLNLRTAKMISEYCRIIVPLRDPLLSLISAHERVITQNFVNNSGGKLEIDEKGRIVVNTIKTFNKMKLNTTNSIELRQLINLFFLVETLDELDNIYIPIDLDKKINITYKGINFSEVGKHGSIGDYPLKQAYYNQDLPYIKKELDVSYDSLKSMQFFLQPFFEKHGYKDLLWW